MKRRTFLARTAAIAGAGLANTTHAAQAAAQPHSLRIVGPGPARTLFRPDPTALARSTPEGVGPIIAAALYEGLTSLRPDGRVTPAIAREWTSSERGKAWTFIVREDCSARKIAAHLQRLAAPDGPLQWSSYRFETGALIERWEAKSDEELSVTLKLPLENFPRIVAGTVWKLPAPARAHDSGTGPYLLNRIIPGWEGSMTLVPRLGASRSPRGRAERPLEAAIVATPWERGTQVETGEADVALGMTGQAVTRRGFANARILRSRWDSLPSLVARADMMPGGDPVTMRALKGIIDREALLNDVFDGFGERGADIALDDAQWMRRAHERCIGTTDNAMRVLGAMKIQPLALMIHYPEHAKIAHAVTRQLNERLGDRDAVRAEVGVVSRRLTGFWEKPWIVSPVSRRADPRMLLWLFASPDWSETKWRREGLDILVERTFTQPRATERSAAFARALTTLACHAPSVIPVVPDRIDLLGPRVAGVAPQARRDEFAPDDFVDRL